MPTRFCYLSPVLVVFPCKNPSVSNLIFFSSILLRFESNVKYSALESMFILDRSLKWTSWICIHTIHLFFSLSSKGFLLEFFCRQHVTVKPFDKPSETWVLTLLNSITIAVYTNYLLKSQPEFSYPPSSLTLYPYFRPWQRCVRGSWCNLRLCKRRPSGGTLAPASRVVDALRWWRQRRKQRTPWHLSTKISGWTLGGYFFWPNCVGN